MLIFLVLQRPKKSFSSSSSADEEADEDDMVTACFPDLQLCWLVKWQVSRFSCQVGNQQESVFYKNHTSEQIRRRHHVKACWRVCTDGRNQTSFGMLRVLLVLLLRVPDSRPSYVFQQSSQTLSLCTFFTQLRSSNSPELESEQEARQTPAA